MKNIFTLVVLFIISTSVYSQTIEVLKLNKEKSLLKLSNGNEITIPKSENLNFKNGEIEINKKYVYSNNKKIGKYSKYKLTLDDGTKMFFWKNGNEIFLGNGKRKSKHEIYAKATLKFNEDYDYLEKITVDQINFENKELIESLLAVCTIENLTKIPKNSSDDYLFGIVVGTIIGK